jgi:hypothetical protein
VPVVYLLPPRIPGIGTSRSKATPGQTPKKKNTTRARETKAPCREPLAHARITGRQPVPLAATLIDVATDAGIHATGTALWCVSPSARLRSIHPACL